MSKFELHLNHVASDLNRYIPLRRADQSISGMEWDRRIIGRSFAPVSRLKENTHHYEVRWGHGDLGGVSMEHLRRIVYLYKKARLNEADLWSPERARQIFYESCLAPEGIGLSQDIGIEAFEGEYAGRVVYVGPLEDGLIGASRPEGKLLILPVCKPG